MLEVRGKGGYVEEALAPVILFGFLFRGHDIPPPAPKQI